MDIPKESQMKRRAILSTAATTGIAALAGCAGSTDDSDDGEQDEVLDEDSAVFTEEEIDTPAEVTINEPFTVTVSVNNAGGESGTFEDTLMINAAGDIVTHEDFQEPVVIEDIEPTETESIAIEIPEFEFAGEQILVLTEEDIEEPVSIEPVVAEIGEAAMLDNDLKLNLSGVSYETSVFYEYERDTGTFGGATTDVGLQTAPSGQIYAVYEFEIENIGSDESVIDIEAFEIINGDVLTAVGGEDLSNVTDFDGVPLPDVALGSGETTTAWLMVQIDRETVETDTFELGYQRDDRGTRPEIIWIDPTRETELPKFDVTNIEIPEKGEVTEELTFKPTVENVGEDSGKFRGILQRRNAGSDDWIDWESVTGTIGDGEQETFEVTMIEDAIGVLEYRFQPSDEDLAEVEIVPATRDMGEWFTLPSGLEARPVQTRESDEFVTVGTGTIGDSHSSGDGSRFIHVGVELNRPSPDAGESISQRNLSLVTEGARYDREFVDTFAEYDTPFEGARLGDVDAELDNPIMGYISFEIPDKKDIPETTLRWQDDDVAIEWSLQN